MTQIKATVAILVLLSVNKLSYQWFFKSTNPKAEQNTESSIVPVPDNAPFEMKTSDEKFLMLAEFIKDLTPLEACHHLVVAEIQHTCSDISEEDLGKLSVNLLNCQSESEGRPVYSCTSDMTIAECTQDMDNTVWNSYQIVSNRARAICYNTRQQQFRMKTEQTVNRLVHSAEFQLNAMGHIKEGQDKVITKATETLEQMKLDQAELITQQDRLKNQQISIQSSIAVTLEDLYKEKALIASGHEVFAEMTDVLKQKLDNATEMLATQQNQQKHNHREILSDLTSIHEKTEGVWQRIDEGNQQVLEFQRETTEHYRETLENLEKVNNTVNFVMQLINNTHQTIENKLNWILEILGTSGDSLDFVLTIVLHLLYFMLAAFSASFLNTPMFSRLLLMALVPLNAWSEIKTGKSLGFLPMTMFILLSSAANWMAGWMFYVAVFKNKDRQNQLPIIPSPVAAPAALLDQRSPATTSQHKDEGSDDTGKDKYKNGLTNEQLQKLVEMLQKLHASGLLSPDRDLESPVVTTFPNQHVPVNTPCTIPLAATHEDEDLNFSFSEKAVANALFTKGESQRKDTPNAVKPTERFKGLATSSPRVDLVKRHLMRTLAEELNCPEESEDEDALQPPPTPSDTLSRTSTPFNTPRSSKKRGVEGGLNQSSQSKPQCLATTKAGMPCKNSSVDGSAFCRRHQVT